MSRIAFVVEGRYREPVVETDSPDQLYVPSFMYLIATALTKRGHKVDIYTNTARSIEHEGICYRPIAPDRHRNQADVVVMHNGAEDLRFFTFGRAAIWQHNAPTLSKSWKRGELGQLLQHRPDVICLSRDAINKTTKWLPYGEKHLIPHAIHDAFLNAGNSDLDGRAQRAFFASRPTRNLDFLIHAWETRVHPELPEAELVICCPPTNKPFPFDEKKLLASGIRYVGSLDLPELVELGKTSRFLTYPGHAVETGCRVALDAIGMGLPVITCGIGSLKDLVFHGKTGFVEKTEDAFARRIIECMTQDELWQRLSEETLRHPWRQSYDQNALLWEAAFGLN